MHRVGLHDFRFPDLVVELAVRCKQRDLVAQLHISKRTKEGIPMRGESNSPMLSWKCCSRNVAHSKLQRMIVNPFQNHGRTSGKLHFADEVSTRQRFAFLG